MRISLRSIKNIIQDQTQKKRISKMAVRVLQEHLEGVAKEMAKHASRIHDRENTVRAQVGERKKVVLAEKHFRMALEGKFPELRFRDYDERQS